MFVLLLQMVKGQKPVRRLKTQREEEAHFLIYNIW